MKPKRVLYLSCNSRRAGAEQVTSLLIRHHDRKRWDPRVFFFSDGPFREELTSQGVPCHISQRAQPPRLRDPVSVYRAITEVAQLIRDEKIDLVHSVMGYAHLFGGIAALAARVPSVWFQHGPTGGLDWLTGRVPTRSVFVNSHYTLEKQKKFHAWTRSLRLVYPGVEARVAADLRLESAQLRKQYGLEGELVVGIVGRISRIKGHFVLFDAIALLKKSGHPVRLLLIGEKFGQGDDAWSKEVRHRIEELGLSEEVVFTGFLEDPAPAMAACDVVVNCSTVAEGFGLTLIEAMVLEKAVIAPRLGGPKEIIEDQRDGFLFEVDSAVDLARCLRKFAVSSQLRELLGKQARVKVLDRFMADRMTREVETEYEKALK